MNKALIFTSLILTLSPPSVFANSYLCIGEVWAQTIMPINGKAMSSAAGSETASKYIVNETGIKQFGSEQIFQGISSCRTTDEGRPTICEADDFQSAKFVMNPDQDFYLFYIFGVLNDSADALKLVIPTIDSGSCSAI